MRVMASGVTYSNGKVEMREVIVFGPLGPLSNEINGNYEARPSSLMVQVPTINELYFSLYLFDHYCWRTPT